MLVQNNSAAPVNLNLRDGQRYHVGAGRQITLPDSYTTLLDDNASTIALFNSGVLTALTDAGAPFPNFPTSVSAADSKAGRSFGLTGLYDANGNPTITGDGAAAVRGAVGALSDYCLFWFPMRQSGNAANVPKDYSNKGNNAKFGGSVSAPWANAGYLTNQALAGAGVSAKAPIDMGKNSGMLVVTINQADPAAVQAFAGNAEQADGSSKKGVILASRSTGGKVAPRVNQGATTTILADSALSGYFDGTDHQIVLAWDKTTGDVYLYKDGVLDTRYAAAYTPANALPSSEDMFIGSTSVGNPVALKSFGWGCFEFPGTSLPLNMEDIVANLNRHRRTGLPAGFPAFF